MLKKGLLVSLFAPFALFAFTLTPGTPVQVGIPNKGSGVPSVVTGNSLGFVVLWEDQNGSINASFSSDNGQTWGSPTDVSDSGNESSLNASANDLLFVATWTENNPGISSGTIFSSYSTDGVNWSSPEQVSPTNGAASAILPVIGIGTNGTGFISSWTSNGSVYTNFSADGTSWDPNSAVGISMGMLSDADAALVSGNAQGYLVVFIASPDSGTNFYGYASFSSNNGSSWSTPVQVTTSGKRADAIAVQGNSFGFMVVWMDGTATFWSNFSSNNGANWSSPTQMATNGINTQLYQASLSGTDAGFVASWIGTGEQGFATFSGNLGATWNSLVTVSPENLPQVEYDTITVSATGENCLFSYLGASKHVYAVYSPFAGGSPPPPPPSSGQIPQAGSVFFKQTTPESPGGSLFH